MPECEFYYSCMSPMPFSSPAESRSQQTLDLPVLLVPVSILWLKKIKRILSYDMKII